MTDHAYDKLVQEMVDLINNVYHDKDHPDYSLLDPVVEAYNRWLATWGPRQTIEAWMEAWRTCIADWTDGPTLEGGRVGIDDERRGE